MDQRLIDILRIMVPAKIAEELVNVQKIDMSAEDLGKACDVLAALHNMHHPEDNWHTSLVAKLKTTEEQTSDDQEK